MSITFPRLMIPTKRVQKRFELLRSDASSPENSGRLGSVQIGFPRWEGVWEYSYLTDQLREEVRAWFTSLRGSQRTFFAVDGRRPRPLNGVPGAVTGWAVNADRITLSINTGTPDFAAKTGDYVGFQWVTDGAQRRFLVRALEDGVSGGGYDSTFQVEPPLPAYVPSDATAVLIDPDCIMRMDPARSEIGQTENGKFMTIRITGVQELRA